MHRHHTHFAAHSRGGHGRHRARRGAIINSVLTLVAERPMHGYELITELGERSNGKWRPSPGTMYPALKRMEAKGLIVGDEVDGKRQFSLTDEGREMLDVFTEFNEQTNEGAAPWDDHGTGQRGDLRSKVSELTGQVRQIGRFGSAEQAERAAEVLDDAKRKLYAILASGADTDGDSGTGDDSDR